MVVKYGQQEINVISFDSLVFRSSLDTGADKSLVVSLTVPHNPGTDALFNRPYEDITITFDGIDYSYKLLSVDKQDEKITLKCSSLLYEKLASPMTATFNQADYNPIQAVMDLLTEYSIDYDRYSFEVGKAFFGDISVTMDTVFIKEGANTLTVLQMITEILKRIGCDIIIDMSQNMVFLHNFLRVPDLSEYQAVFSDDYIDPLKVKITESKEFFNSFSIGVYPASWANMVYEYVYEVDIDGVLYNIHQSMIDVDEWIAGRIGTIRYDQEISGVFIKGGSLGTLTGNKTLWSTDLDEKTVNVGNYSQKSLYGTVASPLVREWKDERANNSKSVARHTSLTGAFKVGNRIVQSYWRKREQVDFQYPVKLDIHVGDCVLWRNKRFVVMKKTMDFNRQYNYLIEEFL